MRLISMDFLFILLVGLSSMFTSEFNVVETRIVPLNNHLHSYDYYDFGEYDEFDFTVETVASGDGSGERGQYDLDFGSSELEELPSSPAPLHSSPKTFASNSQDDYDLTFDENEIEDVGSPRIATQASIHNNVDFENGEFFDSGIRNNKVGSSENYSSPEKFHLPTHTFHFETITPKYILDNGDENKYESSGSGDGIENGEDSYRVIYVPDYDINDTKLNVEVTPVRKSSFDEISSQRNHSQTVTSSSDEDFEFSGNGKENRDENDPDSSEYHSAHTPSFPNSDDEEYDLSGSGDGSGDGNNFDYSITPRKNTLHSLYTTISTGDTYEQGYYHKASIPDHYHYSENEGSNNDGELDFPKIVSLEITEQKYYSKKSDDEEFEYSGSDNRSGAEHDTASSDLEITTRYLPKQIVIDSDDEDHELSGEGDGSRDGNNIYISTPSKTTTYSFHTTSSTGDTYEQGYYPKTSIPDHYYYSGNKESKNGNESDFPRISSLEITTPRYYLKKIAPNSDDEEFEYSGSGNGSGAKHDTTSLDLEITTRYLPKKIGIYSDDEDYELSGESDGSGDGNYIDYSRTPSKTTPHPLHTTSSTGDTYEQGYYPKTSTPDHYYYSENEGSKNGNELDFPRISSLEITTPTYYSKKIAPNSDNEEFEYSGSGDGSGAEHDINSLVLEITTRYLPKEIVIDSDDEDYELSGEGDGSGDGNSIDYSRTPSKTTLHPLHTTSSTGDTYEQGYYPKTSMPDRFYYSENKGSKNGNELDFPRFSSLEITTPRYYSKKIAPNSDDEEFEFSGSGDASGAEHDTNSFDRYLPKKIVIDSDDEDYELSGEGDGSGDGNNIDYSSIPSKTTPYSLHTTSSTGDTYEQRYYPKTSIPDYYYYSENEGSNNGNILDFPRISSLEITTPRFYSKKIALNSDDEEFEYSGSGNGSGAEHDTNPLYHDTTRYLPKNIVTDIDDEDYGL